MSTRGLKDHYSFIDAQAEKNDYSYKIEYIQRQQKSFDAAIKHTASD